MDIKFIRNFSIIAHIDHGKSTLADRILELTGTVESRDMTAQLLDSMELEKEKGITIKAQAVRLNYKADDGNTYLINLIDTPGHVDFTYGVSQSLSACDGAVLIVDAGQGVEAQTLANLYLAVEKDLEIFPVINKIDLPGADIEGVKEQIEDVLGLPSEHAVLTSAKNGIGIKDVLEGVVKHIPHPVGDENSPLKALIFDSFYDTYQGVVVYIRVFDGVIRPGMKVSFMATGEIFDVVQVGTFSPKPVARNELCAGEVGYFTAAIKELGDVKVGDTVIDSCNPAKDAVSGYKEIKPMVFCGLYPIDSAEYESTKTALEKLFLNDSSFSFEPETSSALGFGFRCGFLGLLHMEIIQERLEREFSLTLITTAPTVKYKIISPTGEEKYIHNPSEFPPGNHIDHVEEPMIIASVMVPNRFIGGILSLMEEKRGTQKKMEYIGGDKVIVQYELPLNEIVLDFYDRLKSVTKGYASFDYEYMGYKESKMIKLDILLNSVPVDALSTIVFKDKAYYHGKQIIEKLKKLIPRQMFEVAIQAAIGNKVVARESIRALRKNVTAKCYGGDISRKRKLLEKQKAGKKRMKIVGSVEIPQEAFMAVLQLD